MLGIPFATLDHSRDHWIIGHRISRLQWNGYVRQVPINPVIE